MDFWKIIRYPRFSFVQLDFSQKDYNKIVAMYSRENENIVLEKEVSCVGGVEYWLNNLLIVHQQSVGGVISQGLQILAQGEMNLLELIDNSVLQVMFFWSSVLLIRLLVFFLMKGRFIGIASIVDSGIGSRIKFSQTR